MKSVSRYVSAGPPFCIRAAWWKAAVNSIHPYDATFLSGFKFSCNSQWFLLEDTWEKFFKSVKAAWKHDGKSNEGNFRSPNRIKSRLCTRYLAFGGNCLIDIYWEEWSNKRFFFSHSYINLVLKNTFIGSLPESSEFSPMKQLFLICLLKTSWNLCNTFCYFQSDQAALHLSYEWLNMGMKLFNCFDTFNSK